MSVTLIARKGSSPPLLPVGLRQTRLGVSKAHLCALQKAPTPDWAMVHAAAAKAARHLCTKRGEALLWQPADTVTGPVTQYFVCNRVCNGYAALHDDYRAMYDAM